MLLGFNLDPMASEPLLSATWVDCWALRRLLATNRQHTNEDSSKAPPADVDGSRGPAVHDCQMRGEIYG